MTQNPRVFGLLLPCATAESGFVDAFGNLHLIQQMANFPPIFRPAPRGYADTLDSMLVCHSRHRHPSTARRLVVLVSLAACALLALAPPCRAYERDVDGLTATLPDAPKPQTARTSEQKTGPGRDNTFLGLHVGPAYPLYANKQDTIINPGEHAPALSATDKLLYAGHEQTRWAVIMPGVISAGYGHLVDTDPHTGTDLGGFGQRLALTVVRQATDRVSGDGIFTALFHQDPRFYRAGHGPLVHRGLLAVKQTYVRLNDSGEERPSFSGLLGHAVGSFLAMTYYPHESATAAIAARGFGTAVAGDMGSKLLLEFGPDALRLALYRKR
jgi:hypothetical protein